MANITWKRSTPADVVIGANGADDLLAGWNTAITANSANADFLWEVASYVSTSPRSLLIRRKDLSAGRIILFGQQASTPNAAAVRGTPAASLPYIGYSATSTSNTVDASYLSAAPLSASDYIPAVVLCQVPSATYRFWYGDTALGMVFCYGNVANGWSAGVAGNLIVDLTGTNLPMIAGGGSSFASVPWSTTTASASVFNPAVAANTGYVTTAAALVVRIGAVNQLCYRAHVYTISATLVLGNPSATKAFFMPIVILGNTDDLTLNVVGKLNQIAIGPQCVRETTLSDGTTAGTAYGHSYKSASVDQALWLINTEI